MDNLVSSPDSFKLKSDDVGDGKDMISKLPDGVLHHILSFVSTKDAVRTSILARRWRFLWTYLSDFILNIYLHDTGSSLFNLVDKMLQKAKYIKRFHLLVSGIRVGGDQVNSLLSSLLKCKIEELYLNIFLRSSFVLSNNLVALESLNMLDLNLQFGFKIPCCIYFPGLKSLKLSFGIFSDETSFQQFFSGCPVLQKLTLNRCYWDIKNASIKIPTLTTLIIDDDGDYFDEYDFSRCCKVTIDAVNLISLSCTNYFRVEFVPINITSLVEASIHVWGGLNDAQTKKLLSGISHVKSLKLSGKILWILFFFENLLPRVPTFHNLTHLRVELGYISMIETLIDILEKSPKLEVLDITEGLRPKYCRWDEEEWIVTEVPLCLTSSLKLINISDFNGCEVDMQFLSFMLKYATSLARIKIFCFDALYRDLKKQAEIINELQILGGNFKSCAIEFHKVEQNF